MRGHAVWLLTLLLVTFAGLCAVRRFALVHRTALLLGSINEYLRIAFRRRVASSNTIELESLSVRQWKRRSSYSSVRATINRQEQRALASNPDTRELMVARKRASASELEPSLQANNCTYVRR